MAAPRAAATFYTTQQQQQQPQQHSTDYPDAANAVASASSERSAKPQEQPFEQCGDTDTQVAVDSGEDAATNATTTTTAPPTVTAVNKNLMLCRRFKDSAGVLRNFNSLPLFVYATSPSTRATSADGVGILKELTAAEKNMAYDLQLSNRNLVLRGSTLDCLPAANGGGGDNRLGMSASTAMGGPATTTLVVGGAAGVGSYQHHLNLTHHLHPLATHHSPYSNNYPMHHAANGHHHLHNSDQAKSLQELQHEVGALLEFRDLVIETFPDLKMKMASMTSSASSAAAAVSGSASGSVSGVPAVAASSSLASRREWEPGIRAKHKLAHKEFPAGAATTAGTGASAAAGASGGELSSLSRSRSNSHSGKKEPKSGENNNGSVIQDSGFSTETSSSKEGHSASSTNGALTNPIALNRLQCLDADDELLNLLDVIHRKSNRLREEVEHLQNYERQNLRKSSHSGDTQLSNGPASGREASEDNASKAGASQALTPATFREHVERLNKQDIMQLRKERDKLLDKLAEMEAETLTGRIRSAKMSDQVEELTSVKKDLEEQLKLAMAQKLELSSRLQQLQQQSKSSSSVESRSHRPNTFQPVVVIDQQEQEKARSEAFHHQRADSDRRSQQATHQLGRLDGVVSIPGGRNTKCRNTDSERITAILLETNVLELQRHLLTLSVQNQILMQKLEQTTKSKLLLSKRLDKSKDDVDDLRFQLEEKNIELEGTKAQLRVLEARMNASTPSSVAATNSFMHSQNDYETNRSSASTTLMLSRRGFPPGPTTEDVVASLSIGQMPQPSATQISTPSMKAMVHLPMDELQHHSSSTESAHDHDMQQELMHAALNGKARMSSSVGGVSPFDQATHLETRAQLNNRKMLSSAISKPSKIPLPGSKAASYCAGKPPSGRPLTGGGRSPSSSANTSTGSNASNRSPLSRSTGNLLYSKSPNSLKRADSSQSIRKDNSSLSTSNSRSSTSSSIPMATTPYSAYKTSAASPSGAFAVATPSPRLLQNSPLPKPKRESLTSKVRHLDSLSRAQQHTSYSQLSNDSECSSQSTSATTPTSSSAKCSHAVTPPAASTGRSHLTTSTPKASNITAQVNASLRKELQLSGSTTHTLRRATTGATKTASASSSANGKGGAATSPAPSAIARRFSSASVIGSRGALSSARNQQHDTTAGVGGIGGGGGGAAVGDHQQNGSGVASDSDSGKRSTFNNIIVEPRSNQTITTTRNLYPTQTQHSNTTPVDPDQLQPFPPVSCRSRGMLVFPEATPQSRQRDFFAAIQEEDSEDDYLPEDTDEGSDHLLVTFDYGSCDSLQGGHSMSSFQYQHYDMMQGEGVVLEAAAPEEYAQEEYGEYNESESISDDDLTNPFRVHRMHHDHKESVLSLLSSYTEYDVDASLPETYTTRSTDLTKKLYNNFERKFYDGIGFY